MSALSQLADEVRACRACGLGSSRLKAVPGEGPEDAAIMFIGEAPGYHENQQGRPFVGPAGQFLHDLLASIGLQRADVYIANVIKCRPPENRDPLPNEIEACRTFLDRQTAIIKPRLIVTLGRYSMARYFPGASISRIHGSPKREGDTIYFPMYHPAAALHQPSLKEAILQDMQKVPSLLAELEKLAPAASAQPEGNGDATQLSLF